MVCMSYLNAHIDKPTFNNSLVGLLYSMTPLLCAPNCTTCMHTLYVNTVCAPSMQIAYLLVRRMGLIVEQPPDIDVLLPQMRLAMFVVQGISTSTSAVAN